MKDAVIILCGGGPAPGMNSVSMSVAKTFLTKGFRVIGLHGGYSGLFSKNARTEDITFFIADRYFNRGGSYLEMSRFKPTDADFENSMPVGVDILGQDVVLAESDLQEVESAAWSGEVTSGNLFLRALYDYTGKQFNSSLAYYSQAVEDAVEEGGYESLYSAFYRLNRGVLRAEMIEFISSMESNVQVLSMDDSGTTRARVKDQITRQYDYTEAIEDMQKAAELVPNLPYAYYNLGNLYCLSSELINSIDNYTKAIDLYPYMGDAYFNRGLVLIYLKDKEKGCIDLSRAGELGVQDAYGVIKKYCEQENEQ